MKAIVKEIEVDTWADDEGDHFHFVAGMKRYIKKTLDVSSFWDYKNWFQDKKTGWIYHRSWLEFIE